MPEATERLREAMRSRFGTIDAGPPQRYLEERGFVLLPNWCWEAPSLKHPLTDNEEECLEFLFQEWDFGGLVRR